MLCKYGPTKGQVRYAVRIDGPQVLLRSLTGPSLTVFVGGAALLSCRLRPNLDAAGLEQLAATPGVFQAGGAWYYAAGKATAESVFRPLRSAEEWEEFEAGTPEASYHPEPSGQTTHWPAARVKVWTLEAA